MNTSSRTVDHPGVLLVLDGWGLAPPAADNAIALACTPALDALAAKYPHTVVAASGTAVGLPPSTVGNSEIGHLTIGAGRVLDYDSVAVQRQVDSGQLRRNSLLTKAFGRLAATGTTLHLIGLASDGHIHADLEHLCELIRIAAHHNVSRVAIHAITDGRDVADGTADGYLQRIESCCATAGAGYLASVTGRGYAMDKSGDLALTAQACQAILDGSGKRVSSYHDAPTGAGDEWTAPTVLTDPEGHPVGAISSGDAVLFTNFRSDRIQQLADMLVQRARSSTPRRDIQVLSLTQYDTHAAIPALVPRGDASGGLADTLESHGLKSIRIAEAEKFEHVTFYLNGRSTRRRDVEEHFRVTSPGAPDYRACPQMNLARLTDQVDRAARRHDIALVVANLANIDVVGHTGDLDATRRATEHVDTAVGEICAAAATADRWVLLVGDHGNGEQMTKPAPSGLRPYGGHTTNPVPAILVPAMGQHAPETLAGGAALTDIAPTVLGLLGCPAPAAMTGRTLL